MVTLSKYYYTLLHVRENTTRITVMYNTQCFYTSYHWWQLIVGLHKIINNAAAVLHSNILSAYREILISTLWLQKAANTVKEELKEMKGDFIIENDILAMLWSLIKICSSFLL